jgi:hypothetical protein
VRARRARRAGRARHGTRAHQGRLAAAAGRSRRARDCKPARACLQGHLLCLHCGVWPTPRMASPQSERSSPARHFPREASLWEQKPSRFQQARQYSSPENPDRSRIRPHVDSLPSELSNCLAASLRARPFARKRHAHSRSGTISHILITLLAAARYPVVHASHAAQLSKIASRKLSQL